MRNTIAWAAAILMTSAPIVEAQTLEALRSAGLGADFPSLREMTPVKAPDIKVAQALDLGAPLKTGPGDVSSIYTSIEQKDCRIFSHDTGEDWSRSRCAGYARYGIITEYGDARESITVVTPAGKEYPQDYWTLVSPAFSSLGKKAEWRVQKVNGKMVPIALIVRHDSFVPAGDHQNVRTVSRLVVSKLAIDEVCVTDVIEAKAGEDQNAKAREAADAAMTRACLPKP